jgi:hypothetical protein
MSGHLQRGGRIWRDHPENDEGSMKNRIPKGHPLFGSSADDNLCTVNGDGPCSTQDKLPTHPAGKGDC